jgi:tetratricopeptide (TPR) repeat protein
MKAPSKEKYIFLIYILLLLVTFIAYEPVRHNGFISYDDRIYVTHNPHIQNGLTHQSLVWAFTTLYASNWHPLTWLSHMLDYQLFGLNPLWHHLTSLLLHLANAMLLFLVLKKMTTAVWPSAFVAAAFALHPLHVESVAWVAERKDVLSTFFWLLTMIAYTYYAQRPGIKRYLLTVLAFCLGLLSKPMLVTLPFVLLLLDYWPLERVHTGRTSRGAAGRKRNYANTRFRQFPFSRLIWEKLPLFILSALSGAVTLVAQRGAVVETNRLPVMFRISNAAVSYVKYLGKIFWPSRLAMLYPYPSEIMELWPVIAVIILLLISVCFIYLARKYKYLPVGWLWYLGALIPVIGLVQVGSQAMADRYTYIPSIPIFIIVAFGAAELAAGRRFRKTLLAASAVVILVIMLICTRIQLSYWRNGSAIFRHTLAVTENNAIAHSGLGSILFEQQKFDDAAMHFRQALKIKPKYWEARSNLGKTLMKQGNFRAAVECFNELLLIRTDLPDAYSNLALAYQKLGMDRQAVENYIKFNELNPEHSSCLNNLAWILATTADAGLRNPAAALEYATSACKLEPDFPPCLDTLAAAYAANGRFPEAVKTAQKAIRLALAVNGIEFAQQVNQRLELYKSGRPYRRE